MTKTYQLTGVTRVVAVLTALATVVALSGVAVLAGALQANAAGHDNLANGALIRAEGSIDVYIFDRVGDKSFRRLILNPAIFESYGHFGWGDVQDLPAAVVSAPTTTNLVVLANDDGTLVTGDVYRVVPQNDTGTKHHLQMTPAEFEAAGYDWDAIRRINSLEFGLYVTGAPETAGDVEEEGTTNTEGTMTVARAVEPGNNADVALGSTVPVLGFTIEAELSHLNFQRVDVTFEHTDGDDDLWDYIDSVMLYRGSTLLASKVGSQANFEVSTDDDALRLDGFSSTVALDATVGFEVRVAVTDDEDLNYPAEFDVTIETDLTNTALSAVRAVDGAGINQFGGTANDRNFIIPAAQDAALETSLNPDNYEEAIVQLNENSSQAFNTLLFDMEADNGTVTVTDVVVAVSLEDEGNDDESPGGDLGDYFTVLNIYADGVLVGSEAAEGALAADGAAVVAVDVAFADLDVDIENGATAEWRAELVARAWDTDDLGTWEGYQVFVDLEDAVGTILAEDADGDNVVDTGLAVTGESMHLFTVAPMVAFVSGSLAEVGDADPSVAAGTLVFDVTAVGGDIFVDAATVDGVVGTVMAITAGNPTVDFADAYLVDSTADLTANDNWQILSGQTERFTIDISVTAGTEDAGAEFWNSFLTSLEWGDTDADGDEFTVPAALIEDVETNSISWLVDL